MRCLCECIQKFMNRVDKIYTQLRCPCHLECSPLLSSCNSLNVSATDRNTTGTKFLESRVRWSATLLEFYGHTHNNKLVAEISFLETITNNNQPNQASTECQGNGTLFSTAEIAALQQQVCQHNVMVYHPDLVPPLFWTYSMQVFPHTLQNFSAVTLVNHEQGQIPAEECPHNPKRSQTYL